MCTWTPPPPPPHESTTSALYAAGTATPASVLPATDDVVLVAAPQTPSAQYP